VSNPHRREEATPLIAGDTTPSIAIVTVTGTGIRAEIHVTHEIDHVILEILETHVIDRVTYRERHVTGLTTEMVA